ncbi:MAG: tRNA (adenosine(37)-N6)-threonylcarbamoyltransferase complex ATPase subunit type 1 TsaE [Firmicutes bacterium]|nr:tRNA (adenosine(37)-N6)-threonylcarbamoyltransferase complex ATPase subunit type 1 TsaE [Bacillota bacterium]
MENETFCSRSREDTYNFASRMAQSAKPGDIICLTGGLGSGKTVFAKGFAAGLGVAREVVSPTFTMLIEYPIGRMPGKADEPYRVAAPGGIDETGSMDAPGSMAGPGSMAAPGRVAGRPPEAAAAQRFPLYHFDVYRLGERPNDSAAVLRFEDIGGVEYLFGDGVCLIEWAEIIGPAIPEGALWVEIKRCAGDDNEREIAVRRE